MKFIICFLFFSCQSTSKDIKDSSVSDYPQLVYMANKYIEVMFDSTNNFMVSSAISIVKIHNSLEIYNIQRKDSATYYKFQNAFSQKAFTRVIKILEMELSIGMSYYSKKHNLNMGAWEEMKESYFAIDTSTLPKIAVLSYP
jgi:hypothetical protein